MDTYKIMLVDDDLSHLEYTARIIGKSFTQKPVCINDSREVLTTLGEADSALSCWILTCLISTGLSF
ncbi:MAG: hypothetical protein LRY50_04000 [Geovibrio sp.]|nr:hypothetical protein [Geovibrio sp.]